MSEARFALITGAGASTALGRRDPLPMMGQWCGRIVETLDQIEPGLALRVGLDRQMRGDEFERTLGTFLQWVRAMPLMRTFDHLGSPGDLRETEPPFLLDSWLATAEGRIPTVIRAVNQTLWQEFGLERIDETKATAAYRTLAAAIGASSDGQIQLFSATTNYDRSAEAAWHKNGFVVSDGSQQEGFGGSRYLHASEVEPWLDPPSIAHLHLHGAVGWYRDRRGIRIDPADRAFDDREAPAVLYPDPNKDPYNDQEAGVGAIWQVLDNALSTATHILILGHSLHDRPLLTAIERAASRSEGVRIAVSYLPRDDGALSDLLDQLRTTSLVNPTADFSLIPVSFGPEGHLVEIGSWFMGDVLGREIVQGTAKPSARELDDFKILTGQAQPADGPPQGGPAIGLRHVANRTDSFILLRDLPPHEFILEFDAHLMEGGLLNAVFAFDEETWQGYMGRLDSRSEAGERDGFLWMENGRTGTWKSEVVSESNSPVGQWFSVSLRVQGASAQLSRAGSVIATLPSLRVGKGAVGFFTEVATSHIANVRLSSV